LNAGAKAVSVDESYVCVLTYQDEVVIFDAKDLQKKLSGKLPFEGSALIVSGSELWIGDKAGKIHILNHSLVEQQLLTKHSKGVTCMARSHDGTKIATGDQYRYIHIWDTASKAEVAALGEHKDKIVGLLFSDDDTQLFSLTWDLAYGVTTVADSVMK
jgi:WD40 repeat protein